MTRADGYDEFWSPRPQADPEAVGRSCRPGSRHDSLLRGEGFWTVFGYLIWFPLLTLAIHLGAVWLASWLADSAVAPIIAAGLPIAVALIAFLVIRQQGHRGGCAISRTIVQVITAPGRGLTKAVAMVVGVG